MSADERRAAAMEKAKRLELEKKAAIVEKERKREEEVLTLLALLVQNCTYLTQEDLQMRAVAQRQAESNVSKDAKVSPN
jgi:hypothetical protein